MTAPAPEAEATQAAASTDEPSAAPEDDEDWDAKPTAPPPAPADESQVEVEMGSIPPDEARAIDDLIEGEDHIVIDEEELVPDSVTFEERPPPSISAEEFDRARGKPASIPPKSETKSSTSLVAIQILIEVESKLGLTFSSETPQKTAVGIKSLLLDGVWPNPLILRDAMIQSLVALDPKGYPAGGGWQTGSIRDLRTAFLHELEGNEKLAGVHASLRRSLSSGGGSVQRSVKK